MRRRLPPLNAVHAFEAAARHGNFTRAAEELGVAQPAVTRHVKILEDWLGTELFTRSGNAVQLSADGLEASEQITAVLDRLEIGLGQLAAARENEIVIGASFGMTHLWLMPQITAMRDAARGAAINFVTSERYSDFDNARVDFSIRFGAGAWPGKTQDLLFTETVYVIASPAFLQSWPELDPANLVGTLKADWLLEHGDPLGYGWMTWEKWFAHHGAALPGELKRANMQNYPTLLDMVRCGEGLALGYCGLDDHLVEAGDILRLGTPLVRPNVGYYLLSHEHGTNTKACRELRNYLAGIA